MSRNIARHGLKVTTVKAVQEQTHCTGEFFHHEYLLSEEQKIESIKAVLKNWKL